MRQQWWWWWSDGANEGNCDDSGKLVAIRRWWV